MIFVNTKAFASVVKNVLNKSDCKCDLIDGSTPPEIRDKIITKFRAGEMRVLVTTSMLARGLDVPDVQIVINFDVPSIRTQQNVQKGDSETYLHRIGRTGRFGARGVAINLYDRPEDKKFLDQILEEYSLNCE
jgi:ATP-dependent RNA helicase DDX19/DBP5